MYTNLVDGKDYTFAIGDEVLYIGLYRGVVVSATNVRLSDGTIVKCLASQTHKFRKLCSQ